MEISPLTVALHARASVWSSISAQVMAAAAAVSGAEPQAERGLLLILDRLPVLAMDTPNMATQLASLLGQLSRGGGLSRPLLVLATARSDAALPRSTPTVFPLTLHLQPACEPNRRLIFAHLLGLDPATAAENSQLAHLAAASAACCASDLAAVWAGCPGGCDAPGELATALTQHTPAALASLAASGLSVRPVVPDPALALDSVGGAGDAKAALLEAVVWPRLHPKELKAAGIAPARGVLLYGPPGCGKTLLAKAAASTLAVPFLPVGIPDIMRAEVGASQRLLTQVFRVARAASPCVLFLDEVQAMFQKRSGGGGEGAAALAMQNSLTSQLLTELTALTALPGIGVVVMAATNVPGALDPALLRPGRLERCIPVTLPDAAERQTILASVTAKLPCPCEGAGVPGLDLASLAAATAGFSGADLAALVQSCVAQALAAQAPLAAMEAEDPLGLSALKGAVTPSNISQDALLQAAARMQPSVSRQQLQDLAQWERGVH